MDRDTELAHLAIAEKAVALGERHILLQEQRVADLDRHGHDTRQARATLAVFRRSWREHVAHRDLILKMLQQDATKPQLAAGPLFRPGHNNASPVQAQAQAERAPTSANGSSERSAKS